MKKLLGLLTVSLGILAGILAYSYYTGGDVAADELISKLESESEIIDELSNMVEPSALPNRTITPQVTRQVEAPIEDTQKENIVLEEEVVDSETDTDTSLDEKEIIIEKNTHSDLSYAYSCLNEEEKELYDLLYSAIVNYIEDVTLKTKDKDLLDKVFNCVMIDHPEIFYVNGYTYTKHIQGDTIKSLSFSASYCYGQDDKKSYEEKINAALGEILANVLPAANDYDKIKYIYEAIIAKTEYDLNSPDNQNIISVLLNGKSVCQGYAKTFQILLNELNIPCTLVTGMVNSGERHAWNLVKSNGEWYYVDVTWGDASYIGTDGDTNSNAYIPEVNYDYLLVPSAEIDLTHITDTPISMPYTQAMTDNYFVKEGLYITAYDPNQLKTIFDYRKSIAASNVPLKCSDTIVYNQLCSELIDNRKIFDYLGSGKIRYERNDSLHKLVFALN